MNINKILILGSTLLSELSVNLLKEHYDLVGHVPSLKPTTKGVINLPVVDIESECDIMLSIQYDKVVKNVEKCFNVHTGLLPEYGGTNILSYTIKNKEKEQGLTFHKMTNQLDYGPIISKITYPVLKEDEPFDLFIRVLEVGPFFILSSLNILKKMSLDQISNCPKESPHMYKRGEFLADEKITRYRHD